MNKAKVKNGMFKFTLIIIFLVGLLLWESACMEENFGSCGDENFKVSSFDSVKVFPRYGSYSDTFTVNQLKLRLFFSAEKVASIAAGSYSAYATVPCPPPRIKFDIDSARLYPTNPFLTIDSKNWFIEGSIHSTLDQEDVFQNSSFFYNEVDFQLQNITLTEITKTAFTLKLYKADSVIFEQTTKDITLIP